jgi:uncharacterized protein YaaQ
MYGNFKHRSSANSRFTTSESFFRVTRSASCSGWFRHGTAFFTAVEEKNEPRTIAKAADVSVALS